MAYPLTVADFGFNDANDAPNSNSLAAVKITQFPATGSLRLNGNAVNTNHLISASDIALGNLRYTPPLNASNNGLASFRFQVKDDGGTAAGGVDLALASNLITINVTPVNDPPSGSDKTVSTAEDVAYTFTANDFGFSDPSDSPITA